MTRLLLYCVKTKPYLREIFKCNEKRHRYYTSLDLKDNSLNGKIVAECDYKVEVCDTSYHCIDFRTSTRLDGISRLDKSCLTSEQLLNYVKGKNLFYAIHIKNLHIFDESRELSEYHNNNSSPIEKAPQNMMYARQTVPFKKEFLVKGILQEVRGYKVNEYVLISIQPQWLCKILNGEKTIEVRKKVLKEMLNNE